MRRSLIPVVAVVAVLALWGLWQISDPVAHPDDFAQYWGVGRLVLHGGNPYDLGQLVAVEQAQGMATPRPK